MRFDGFVAMIFKSRNKRCPSYVAGGGGGGNWGGDRELQETPDTVFITGLGESIVEDDLLAHFGSIGVIKVCSNVHNCYMFSPVHNSLIIKWGVFGIS